MSVRILRGDCREVLKTLPDESVHCVVTSPPYWGLRDYGVDGQIGLESSPAEFLEQIVEVFREVRRVLRADGTAWVNMGDSYASGGRGGDTGTSGLQGSTEHQDQSKSAAGSFRRDRAEVGATKHIRAPDLKPKDLMMMPARVAMALQAPYYTGSIKQEMDRVWLAAMLDAEGCMFIHKRKAGQSNGQGYVRQNDTYSAGVEICNTSLAVVERIHALVGKGSICSQGPEQNARRRQTIYRWNLRTTESREFVRELYPYLVAKRQQARILYGCPSSGERAEAAHAALIALHRGAQTDVDFPAPPTMFEPGWYLRQDVIWRKPNPMPESITDRCTKSHEYVFLLAKSERYYYDAEAIKEAASENTHARRSTKMPDGWDTGPGAHGSFHRDGREKGKVTVRLPGNKSHKGTTAFEQGDEKHRTKAGLVDYSRKLAAAASGTKNNESFDDAMSVMPERRNKRSVWTIATEAFPEAHFATFPTALAEPCILAGTSAHGCCPHCGAPWKRVVKPSDRYAQVLGTSWHDHEQDEAAGMMQMRGENRQNKARDEAGVTSAEYLTVGWEQTCKCPAHTPVPCTVLDPFGGAGTTALVADRLGRNAVLVELNPAYADMAERRIRGDAPLFAEVSA